MPLGDYSQATGFGGFAARHLLSPAMGIPMGAIAGTLSARAATSAASRGLSRYGGSFTTTTNSAGGRVTTSTGTITQNDFASTVQSSVMRGEQVNILSGVHGEVSGLMRADISLYNMDVLKFGAQPGVNVFNMVELLQNPLQLRALLNGPGTTIGAFCESGACLRSFLP